MKPTSFEALNFIPDGAIVIDQDYHILFWNKQLEAWSKQKQHDVLGTSMMVMFPKLLHNAYRLLINQAFDNHSVAKLPTPFHHHIFEFMLPDGTSQPHQVTITCIQNEHHQAQVLLIIQDMHFNAQQASNEKNLLQQLKHEQQQRENLAQKNRRFIATIEQAGEALLITRATGEVEYANAAFAKQTGWSAETIYRDMQYFSYQASGHIDIEKNVQHMILDGLTWQGKRELKRHDGSLFSVSIRIAPIFNAHGDVTHAVVMQEDISKQIKLEEQYRKTQKQESIATLIGGIAHDFNNLLSGMLGHLYLARRELKDLPKTAERISKVQAVANEAANIVQQLMTFSRSDAIDKRQFPLDSFLKELLKLAEHNIPENIHLSIDFEQEKFPFKGDAERLQQAFMNIMQNAADATAQGQDPQIQLRLRAFDASTSPQWLQRFPLLKQGKYAHMTIWDNGCGIEHGVIECIFDPFFTTKPTCSGLGLSVALDNIKHHDGFMDVESNDQGTFFHVWLPLSMQRPVIAESSRPQPTTSAHQALILVVDDEAMVRETCIEILEIMGYHTLEAKDGVEAVGFIKQYGKAIDLILMDMVMPRMNGTTAAKNIRALYPTLPIIFATAYDQKRSIKSTQNFEHSILIPKPFHPHALQEAIEALLPQSTLQNTPKP